MMGRCSTLLLCLALFVSGILWYNDSTGMAEIPGLVIWMPIILYIIFFIVTSVFRGIIDVLGRLIRRFTHWIY